MEEEYEICKHCNGTGKIKISIWTKLRDFLDEDNCLEIDGVNYEFKLDQNYNPYEISTTRECEINGEILDHPIHFN